MNTQSLNTLPLDLLKEQQEKDENTLLWIELFCRVSETCIYTLHAYLPFMQCVLESTPLVVNGMSGMSAIVLSMSEAKYKSQLSTYDQAKNSARHLAGALMISTAIIGLACPAIGLSMAATGSGIAFVKTLANLFEYYLEINKKNGPLHKESIGHIRKKKEKIRHKKVITLLAAVTLGCMITAAIHPVFTPVLAIIIAYSCVTSLCIKKQAVKKIPTQRHSIFSSHSRKQLGASSFNALALA